MYESLKKTMYSWNNTATDRSKLQHFYIALAVSLLIIAGIIGLLNSSLGQQILAASIATAGIFLINAVAWALLQSFILLRLKPTPAVSKHPTPRKTVRKK